MTTDQKKDILQRLKNIKQNGPFSPHQGICKNACLTYLEIRFLSSIWVKWIKFSKNIAYPVLGYAEYCEVFDLWDTSNYGGVLRFELLDFLIEEISKKIEP